MALMRRGVTDLNTEDPELLDRRVEDLQELDKRVRVKVSISEYETLPAGRMWLHQSWSGDLINAVISYLPKGTEPRRALATGTSRRAGRSSTTSSASAATPQKPVIAHRFLNYMLDNEGRATRTSPATSATSRR